MPYQSKVLLTCKEKEENETLQQEEGNVVMEGILEMDNITTLEHSNSRITRSGWRMWPIDSFILKDIDSKDG